MYLTGSLSLCFACIWRDRKPDKLPDVLKLLKASRQLKSPKTVKFLRISRRNGSKLVPKLSSGCFNESVPMYIPHHGLPAVNGKP